MLHVSESREQERNGEEIPLPSKKTKQNKTNLDCWPAATSKFSQKGGDSLASEVI